MRNVVEENINMREKEPYYIYTYLPKFNGLCWKDKKS